MIFLNNIYRKIFLFLLAIALMSLFASCGIYRPVDARKVSPNADERVKKNLEEGKGFTLMGGLGARTKARIILLQVLIQCGELLWKF